MHIHFYNADSILSVLIVKRIIDAVIIHIYIPHVQVQHMWSTYTINAYHASYSIYAQSSIV